MEFDQFIDELIAEKGLATEDAEVVAQIKEDLAERIESRINALIIESLAPEDLESFEKVLDDGSQEKIQQYIQAHIPEFDEKAAAELMTFRAAYLQ